jgi:hypothetical protein
MKKEKQYLVIVQAKSLEYMFDINLPYNTHRDDEPCDVERAELLLAAFKNSSVKWTAAMERDLQPNSFPRSPLFALAELSVDDINEMRCPPGIRWVVTEVYNLERIFKPE